MNAIETQRATAMERANYVRCEGLRYCREMKALPLEQSRERAAGLLLNPPDPVSRLRVGKFLVSIRGVKRYRAVQLLAEAYLPQAAWNHVLGPMSRTSTHTPLTAAQRARLADAIRGAS